ncbi:hypothetical protein [Flavobacterium phage V157]|uniref:Uncharacterized protein n=10 Tax=Ficleduovirus FCV1 TaxID=2560474 RepID=A0A218M8F0_9CAUD|nr:hypothetical protein [Flavobacterium phage FCV-3]ASD51657.1 hypothetical protein [Flavobacterium phage FCV-11]ASD51731.1 hypothetical protein [Flavobacterium phage V175]ASD51809.1 hypothetical protein [Flavobacterium phage V181]ASD52487.1 hypothetical protein [Flavobacterium phage FCV-10]ASD52560.1 hypothetical protein [Flavobacterium phage FCV-16]ASD52634.1 hypothetical protein [Flavobacterium phage FCV-20]ASD52785.1 hypothetical protein [Flavobacterium phage V156]ASD52863.1 hypothetica
MQKRLSVDTRIIIGFYIRWILGENFDNCVKTIVRYFKWTPQTLNELYCDDLDINSIGYWYNDAVAISKSMDID